MGVEGWGRICALLDAFDRHGFVSHRGGYAYRHMRAHAHIHLVLSNAWYMLCAHRVNGLCIQTACSMCITPECYRNQAHFSEYRQCFVALKVCFRDPLNSVILISLLICTPYQPWILAPWSTITQTSTVARVWGDDCNMQMHPLQEHDKGVHMVDMKERVMFPKVFFKGDMVSPCSHPVLHLTTPARRPHEHILFATQLP